MIQLEQVSPKAIDTLIDGLEHEHWTHSDGEEDWNVRLQAAEGLIQLDLAIAKVVDVLIAALNEDKGDVRSRATTNLKKLGQANPNILNDLVPTIQEAKLYQTRRDAAQLVGELGTAELPVLNILCNGLLDNDDEVRSACATALARLGKRFPQASPIIEDMLIRSVHDPEFEERDEYWNRSAQDYAYDGLWQLVVE